MPHSRNSFTADRTFAWEIVVIGDAQTQDIPSLERDGAIVPSGAAVVVPVRHAQDVDEADNTDFRIRVALTRGRADRDDLAFDGEILVPSGQLAIGDADHEDVVPVTPGRCRLQIDTEPVEYPERITVWCIELDSGSTP